MDIPVTPELIGEAIKVWTDTFVIAVQERNFKNGVFKKQITPTTNVMDAFDIFIASPLLSKEEKAVFSGARADVLHILSKGVQMNYWELVVVMSKAERITDIFDKDLVKQGKVVPPLLLQTTGKDGKVKETFEITNEGTKTTKGGEFGVAPSVPGYDYSHGYRTEVHLKQGSSNGKAGKKSARGDGGQCSKSQYTNPCGCNGWLTVDLVASEGDTKDGGFNEIFKQNLRRAFG